MKSTIITSLLLAFGLLTVRAEAAKEKPTPEMVYGKIQYVTSFPDVKVRVVQSFGDLRVKEVTSNAKSAGEWEIVESLPDFKVEIVTAFEDFTIEYVDAFPGPKR